IQEYTIDTSLTIYDIVLIAGNECGTDTTTQQLVVEPEEVTAFFNTSSTEGCAPFTVSFENFSTLGTFVSWDFGDGNVVSIDDPIHTFQQPGTYDVTLTADNGCGSDTETISITALPPPQVSFEAPEILCTNQEVQLTNTSPNLGGSQWVFSTGDTSTLTNPSYLFDQPGTYTVALTGYAAQSGCSQTVSQQITIQEPPVANFDLDDPDGCAPLNVPFANTSQGGSYYFWNFGDGNTSVEQHPDHVFQNAGTYPISLVVTNQAGCRDTATFANVLAYPTPVASFDLEKEQECGLPLAVSLFNGSSGADGYLWQLGDGAQTDLTNPEHLFDEAGT
ncbi:MAG: PKD domain-containing protein, partial [Saprospiraceae bacterium]|nr:PKD domain-containing protein [Saprospiraceae bacterium]